MMTNSSWHASPYIVILYYNSFSCGKFVSNILSFDRNFVAQIALTPAVKVYNSMIESLLWEFDEELLEEYKLSQIFQTIPPSSQECKNWSDYELGCTMFWGFGAGKPNQSDTHAVAVELLAHKKYCFIVAHNINNWNRVKAVFPNAKTIEIVNDTRIREMSMKLKSVRPRRPSVNRTLPNSFKFDIDCLFDKETFFQQINDLYKYFNIDNAVMHPSVNDYYQQYVNLYE